jgi:cysteine desulfurase
MKDIYLDHAATTPLSPHAREAMLPWLESRPANPSSENRPGRLARAALDRARQTVAASLGANSADQILFTGSGTEANNLAVFGLAKSYLKPGDRVQVGATEHKSVLYVCHQLESYGLTVQTLSPDQRGQIWPSFDDCPNLICLMLANNEIGTVAPIEDIARECVERKILLHCDAVAAVGKIPVRMDQLQVATLALAAHKLYGPTGVGVLFVRQGIHLPPWLQGGNQESGLRPGTHNLAGIVGAAAALQESIEKLPQESRRLRELDEALWAALSQAIPGAVRNGDPTSRVPGLLHLSLPWAHSEALLLEMDQAGIYASAGSACSAGESGPSHVVTALHLPQPLLRGSLRLSLGRSSDAADIERISAVIASAYQRQIKLAGR